MSLPVIVKPLAQVDLSDAADWYEQQRQDLGVDFLGEVQAAFDRITAFPEAYGIVYKDVRRASVRRFSYSIFFRIEPSQISILAVVHHQRDQKVWKSRA